MQEMRFKMSFMMMNDEDILQVAEALMDNCLEGSNENNHAKHTRDFTDRLKHIVTPENLAKQLSHEPVAILRNAIFCICFGAAIRSALSGSNISQQQMMN